MVVVVADWRVGSRSRGAVTEEECGRSEATGVVGSGEDESDAAV